MLLMAKPGDIQISTDLHPPVALLIESQASQVQLEACGTAVMVIRFFWVSRALLQTAVLISRPNE